MSIGVYTMSAHDVMTRRVDTIAVDSRLPDAVVMMVERDLSALPVVDARGVCVGMLTKTDLVRLAGAQNQVDAAPQIAKLMLGVDPRDLEHANVSEVMTSRVVAASEQDTLPMLAEQMIKHQLHHLPICDDQQRLLGVVSSMDLVQALTRPVHR